MRRWPGSGPPAPCPSLRSPQPWESRWASHRFTPSCRPQRGSSTPSHPVQALSTSWTLSAALPIASPSRTTEASTCVMGGSVLPTAAVVRQSSQPWRSTQMHVFAASCCLCYPAAACASGIMASSRTGTRRAPCAAVGNCWARPPLLPTPLTKCGAVDARGHRIDSPHVHCGARPLVRLPLPPLALPAANRGAPLEVPICASS